MIYVDRHLFKRSGISVFINSLSLQKKKTANSPNNYFFLIFLSLLFDWSRGIVFLSYFSELASKLQCFSFDYKYIYMDDLITTTFALHGNSTVQ